MNAIELRIAIFAVRTAVGSARYWQHKLRASDSTTKKRFGVDSNSLQSTKAKAKRVIRSLERHLKRANRLMLRSITREEFDCLMTIWKAHLRWMRVHIAYFVRPRPVVEGRRVMYQGTLDELVRMAERGLRDKGHQAPDREDLRKLMRLYAAYSRRGRIGSFTVPFLMQFKTKLVGAYELASFVLRRRNLPLIGQPPRRRTVTS